MKPTRLSDIGAPGSDRSRIVSILRRVPAGRVTTYALVAGHLGLREALVSTILGKLTEDERESCPWHRVVATGGAIGRGPWRETQFARLIREGVSVSPAGIVQDLARFVVTDLDAVSVAAGTSQSAAAPAPLSRSRGMRKHPDGSAL